MTAAQREQIWRIAWLLLAAWTPPPLRPWRRVVLRLFGAKVSNSAGIYGSARIRHPENFEIGAFAYVGPGAAIDCAAKVRLGDYSLVSQGGKIETGAAALSDAEAARGGVDVGAYAWIAAEAYVAPGVTVGDGAVLGARACAFEDLAPWTIYIGNPATALRPRRRAAG